MGDQRESEEARRSYWTAQMDAATGFMVEVFSCPVEECGEPLVSLSEAVDGETVDVVFSSTPFAERHGRLLYLREGLVEDFVGVARDMNRRGWTLKVEDGFRTREMQRCIGLQPFIFDVILGKVIWENGGDIPSSDLFLRRMAALVASAPKVGTHMSGSAIDVTVLYTDDHSEVDRGGPYIELSELTPMDSPFVPEQAARNRSEITGLMRRYGFMAYPYEFWHYSKGDAYAEYLGDSGRPARYGPIDFDIGTGSIRSVENPEVRLNGPSEIQRNMDQALDRLDAGASKPLRTQS